MASLEVKYGDYMHKNRIKFDIWIMKTFIKVCGAIKPVKKYFEKNDCQRLNDICAWWIMLRSPKWVK